MKPTVEAKHVFGEKKPRLIRTKRILGGLAAVGESKYYIHWRGDEIRSDNKSTAGISSDFIREFARQHEAGFVARTKTKKAEIQLESANQSAHLSYLRNKSQYNQWRLTIKTPSAKGDGHTTIIEGTPYWRHPEDYPGVVSGVDLVAIDPETGKKHYYDFEEQARLQSTVQHAFRELRGAQREDTLEIQPLEPQDVTAEQAA